MRSQAIFMAVFLALSGTAVAQTTSGPSASAPSTCNRTPHAGMNQQSAQLITARQAMKQACAADMANYCAGVPKGCGQEKQCMKAHANQLSASCTSAMQNLRAQRHGA